MEFINYYFIPGLVLGCIYALGAVGVSLLFGILRFAHFAHGDLITLGAYIAFFFTSTFGLSGLLSLPAAILFSIIICILIDRFFYKPLRYSPTVILLISSFGIALMLRATVQLIWGVEIESYNEGTFSVPLKLFDTLIIAEKHIYIVLFTFLIILIMHYFLAKTTMGKAMRAVSDNVSLAQITGINTEKVIIWTWVIGGSLAASAGVFLGIDTQLQSNMGWDLLLPIFAAAILGGIGSPYGAIIGGLIIGMAEELSSYTWLGDELPLLSPGYKSGVAFAIMVLLLIWRPSGILKGKVF
ncbi:MAG: High-affinity branched-chain amino acid transport system permease protein LivH [Alphaproteobacteria bacterium MarineAlpha2_Bin1]|nr:MAG: High-affinity branched-chain amino acid transport system permease protein LivH [Alphaproteobacteria bacterium MarineAlpha2_Bin1]